MKDKQDTQQATFDGASCVAMMQKMVARMGAGCNCAGMTSRMTGQGEQGCCDWSGMMSQMAANCCGTQSETNGEPPAQEARHA